MGHHSYEEEAHRELSAWSREMQRRPGLFSGLSRRVQERLARIIPETVHAAITAVFKVATRFLLSGADFLTARPCTDKSLEAREEEVRRQVERYKYAAPMPGTSCRSFAMSR